MGFWFSDPPAVPTFYEPCLKRASCCTPLSDIRDPTVNFRDYDISLAVIYSAIESEAEIEGRQYFGSDFNRNNSGLTDDITETCEVKSFRGMCSYR